jgi:hypothetical protein
MRGVLLGTMWTAILCAALLAPPAFANDASCPPAAAQAEAQALIDRIAAAPSVDAARELALEPPRGAHFALAQARRVAPWTASLAAADEKLVGYEARIAAAPSQDAVAAELATLAGVHADLGDGGCSYSTGEIIATVLGFILGIIPGIILLFLLC